MQKIFAAVMPMPDRKDAITTAGVTEDLVID